MGKKISIKNGKLENRSVLCEVRAIEPEAEESASGIIEGRPVVYNSRARIVDWFDEWDEEIVSGALERTDLTDVRFLVNHDFSKIPLARSRRNNGNSTMQLFTDDEGLRVRVQLDTENNPDARALYSAISRGDVTGMSFIFSVAKDEWSGLDSDEGIPFRRILQIGSIVEVSAVSFPCYDSTWINVARSKEAPEGAQPSALEKARQQRAAALEKAEIEKIKLKIKILGGN